MTTEEIGDVPEPTDEDKAAAEAEPDAVEGAEDLPEEVADGEAGDEEEPAGAEAEDET